MKKLLVFLCIVFMILGAVGCKSSGSSSGGIGDPVTSVTTPSSGSSSGGIGDPVTSVTTPTVGNPGSGGGGASAVPEPATILLLGSGLVGLAGFGRKKFFNKDQDKG